jgi:hypothetical protein
MDTDTLALLLTFLFVSLIGFFSVITIIVLISRDTTKIPETIARLTNVESIIGELTSDIRAEIVASQTEAIHPWQPQELWRTADGKYEAPSFEALLSKMVDDPDSTLTIEEKEAMQSIFEKIMGVNDDDDDRSDTRWKRGS